MSKPLDPKLNPFRDDIAATKLRGVVDAPRFVEARTMRCAVGQAPLRKAPREGAKLDSELLFGELFDVYEEHAGWAWGQCQHDGYVGYVDARDLSGEIYEPSHRVSVLRTPRFPSEDNEEPPLDGLSLHSPLRLVDDDGESRFVAVQGGGYVFRKHLRPEGSVEPDFVQTAKRFLGVPYVWGGRSSLGLDCSGLVQIAISRAGQFCLRDSYMQAEQLGTRLEVPDDVNDLCYGDLIFFPGHVGFVAEPGTFIHANGFDLEVSVHLLSDVLERALARGQGPTCVRRLALSG